MTTAIRTFIFLIILCCTAIIYAAIHDRSVQLSHFNFLTNHQVIAVNNQPEVKNWLLYAYPYNDYRFGLSKNEIYHGKSSVFIVNKLPIEQGVGLIRQTIKAEQFSGKKIEFSGYFKTAHLKGNVTFELDIMDGNDELFRRAKAVYQPNDPDQQWQRFSVIASIPNNASALSYSAQLLGSGQVWFDDFNLTDAPVGAKDTSEPLRFQKPKHASDSPERTKYLNIVGYNTPPFGELNAGNQSINLKDWWITDDLAGEYSLTQEGNALLLESIVEEPHFGVALKRYQFKNPNVQGIKFSAQIKHQFVKSMASIWLRIEDKDKNNLAFDNLRFSSTGGSSDWQNVEVVLPLSEEAEIISFGALLISSGKLWLRNPHIELLYTSVKVHSNVLSNHSNLSFE